MKRQHRQVEVAKYGEFNFGASLLKKEGFSLKKSSDKAQVGLFAVSTVCAKTKSAWTIAVEHHSAQQLHSFAITLLQILDLFSLIASQFVRILMMSHMYW